MNGGINAAYLLWGIGASFVVVAAATYSLITRIKRRWVEEAAQLQAMQANTRAARDNTAAAQDNSAAIKELAVKLDTYAQRTDDKLNGHSRRIGRLEDLLRERKDP